MNDSSELKFKTYKRFLEMEIVSKKEEFYNAKKSNQESMAITLLGEIKSLRHCLFVFNFKK